MEEKKLYSAAIYARRKFIDIVQPDEPDPTTSEQVRKAKAYLAEYPDIRVDAVYMDSRRMKQDHPRAEFHRLTRDLQEGKYDCLVITSVETFAKDHVECRYYLVHTFAAMGIRIISILDNYDSAISEPEYGKYGKLEELVTNADYFARSRLLSSKAKQKKINGQLELTFTPYGYLYDPDSPVNLYPDPKTADYVRYIFSEFLSGTNRNQIARALTQMGATSPSQRKIELGYEYRREVAKDYWQSGSVNQILHNRMYAGALVFGRQRSAMYVFHDASLKRWTGEEQVIEDHHEALVSKEDFERAQVMLEMLKADFKSKTTVRQEPDMAPTPFVNVVRCGHCGRSMLHTRYKSTRTPYSTYICSSHRMKLPDACPLHPIRLDEMLPVVKQALLEERSLAQSIAAQMEGGRGSEVYKCIDRVFQNAIDSATDAIRENTQKAIALPADAEEERTALAAEQAALRQRLVDALKEKTRFKKTFTADNPWLTLFCSVPADFEITKEWSRKLIDQIDLYRDAPLRVTVKCLADKEKLLSYLEIGKEETDGTKKQAAPADQPDPAV